MEVLILLVIIICLLRKEKKFSYHRSVKKQGRQQTGKEIWQSDWIWDEEKQLWIHPLSSDVPSAHQKQSVPQQDEAIDYSNAYQIKYLLTKNEWCLW